MTAESIIEHHVLEHLTGALFSVEHKSVSARGKVRDMIAMGDRLIMVNTDRISAFDHVFGTIPLKGALLAEQSEFWFNMTRHIVPNHLVERPDPQIMVVKVAEPLMVEVIVRGYLAGSLMRENPLTRGQAYGLSLDPALKNYERLETPIITPTTKAPRGEHDEPTRGEDLIARNIVTKSQWCAIQEIALALFRSASEHALTRGLLLVDTKYEFGLIAGEIHLIDEVHTSDSSRFFLQEDYAQKFPANDLPIMLDKEYLRQRLIAQGINPAARDFFGVSLDDNIRTEVAKRYFRLTESLTGRDFYAPSQLAHARVHQKLSELIC